jgi:hypothetical protein
VLVGAPTSSLDIESAPVVIFSTAFTGHSTSMPAVVNEPPTRCERGADQLDAPVAESSTCT